MYIRTTTVKKKTGNFEYTQLAHNFRAPETGASKAQTLFNFGRADQLDAEAIHRLVKSLSKLLEPEEAAAIQKNLSSDGKFKFLGSRQFGGSWLLDNMWQKLKIDATIKRLLTGRSYQIPIERLIFAMVANRALAPTSKLGMEHWVTEEVLNF